jgi:hypothetical protein
MAMGTPAMLPAFQDDAGWSMKRSLAMVNELADFVQGIATNDVSDKRFEFI